MTNGDEDPWRWASLQKSRKNIISKVYVCPNCGHCVDLKQPSDSDADTLKAVRAEELANVKKWLAEAQAKSSPIDHTMIEYKQAHLINNKDYDDKENIIIFVQICLSILIKL
uniref:Uncharacterized protein n=1 Tax=Nymphaea colorata TaxID=210225 RepID=A0A5K1HUE3_9MAGN|nr:unnamed protein product [Nymphaea colorata]